MALQQFCKRTTLSQYILTYFLYELYKEENLYHLISWRRDLDERFNSSTWDPVNDIWIGGPNSIMPTTSEKPYLYRVDETSGSILESAQFIKKISKKHLVKEWVEPDSPRFFEIKDEWTVKRKLELGIDPADSLFETFRPVEYFSEIGGYVYYNIEKPPGVANVRPLWYIKWDEEVDGSIFEEDNFPVAIIFESNLSYDSDPTDFFLHDDIKKYVDSSETTIVDSDDFNRNLTSRLTYNKILLIKDPRDINTGEICGLREYNPNELLLKDDTEEFIPIFQSIPIEITFNTSVIRDPFQRDVLQSIIEFLPEN